MDVPWVAQNKLKPWVNQMYYSKRKLFRNILLNRDKKKGLTFILLCIQLLFNSSLFKEKITKIYQF